MSQEMDDLTREVAEIKDVVASATALISGLRDQLIAAGTDKVKLAALAADLDTTANALAAAVAENTPADPEPEPEPTV